MRRKILLVIGAAMLATPGVLHAQNWVEYARGEDSQPRYYDPARVRYRGNIAIVWQRVDYMRVTPTEAYRLSRVEIDCDAETSQFVYTVAYSADGRVVATDDVPSDRSPITPGSVIEALMETVCPAR